MCTRVYSAKKFENFNIKSIGGHTDCIVNSFFEEDSLDVSCFLTIQFQQTPALMVNYCKMTFPLKKAHLLTTQCCKHQF